MEKILDTIRSYEMIRSGMHVLAGVSGGADSVCLLYALMEYRKECDFTLTVVHVEHGIRGEESLQDAGFVEELCRKLEVPCRVVHCDVLGEAAKSGLSVEEAARNARYRIFEEVQEEVLADVTAVAHNEKDQAETVLWNLVRGSGLKGLGGIQPVRDRVIRPLLFTSREEIEEILRERGISYRTDRTNLETEYTRNRLRLELIPYMEQYLNQGAVKHIAEAAESLREVQDYMDRQMKRAAERCIFHRSSEVVLDLGEYEKQDDYIQGELLRQCIRLCLKERGLKDIGRVHIRMLRDLAGKPCGKTQDLPGNLQAVRQRDEISFQRNISCEEASPQEYTLPDSGCLQAEGYRIQTERIPAGLVKREEIFTEKKYTKWISCDKIESNVCFRKRKTGDYLIVNSQGGRKKLKDYMIDEKIPRRERDQMWLVADGSHVLWLPGYRISEAAKVTETTNMVLKITLAAEQLHDHNTNGGNRE